MSTERIRIATRLLTGFLVTVSAGVALAGCGESKTTNDSTAADESAVRSVLVQLQQSAVAGDGAGICNQIFTPKLADSVTKSAKSGSCAKEVKKKLFSPKTRITTQAVRVVDDANATATVKEASGAVSTVFFVRQSGRWRIRSISPA